MGKVATSVERRARGRRYHSLGALHEKYILRFTKPPLLFCHFRDGSTHFIYFLQVLTRHLEWTGNTRAVTCTGDQRNTSLLHCLFFKSSFRWKASDCSSNTATKFGQKRWHTTLSCISSKLHIFKTSLKFSRANTKTPGNISVPTKGKILLANFFITSRECWHSRAVHKSWSS